MATARLAAGQPGKNVQGLAPPGDTVKAAGNNEQRKGADVHKGVGKGVEEQPFFSRNYNLTWSILTDAFAGFSQ
jgi:hypothetical protein